MKTTTITILLFVASLFAHGQINNNSTRTNSNGDVQLRRYSAGDTAWKRALVVGYNPSNSNGRLYLNYGGDFKDGLRINGSIVSIDGNVGIGTTSPSHELVVQGASSPNIELKNSNYSNGGFILNRTNYGHQWKWWAESNIMYFGFSTDESNYANKFTIKSNGNVGIGTMNTNAKLTLSNSSDYSKILQLGADGPTHWFMGIGNGNGDFFHIGDNSNKRLIIRKASGNVGIGTTSPSHELVVQGASSPNIELKNSNYSNGGFILNRTNYGHQWKWWAESNIMYFGFSTDESNYANKFTIKSNGNVGIGIINPKEKLAVNGNIRAKEVKVELENWPDYVFTADYKLPSLTSVKAFITKNGHLPNIPAAAEVHDQGVALGDISAKLLQKIEELTLYTLQQEEKLQQQQQLIDALSARLSQMDPQIMNAYETPTP